MSNQQTITDQEAASQFFLSVLVAANDAWPVIFKQFKDCYKEKFVFVDQTIACYDLSLAIMALELEAVKNLFTASHLGRINSWVMKYLDTPEWGEYSKKEIKEYQKAFEDDLDLQNKEHPLGGVGARLLCRWLGDGIREFEVNIGNKSTGIINPLLVMQIFGVLTPFLGFWGKIKSNYSLVESDLPIDFDQPKNSLLDMGSSKVSDRKYKVLIKGAWGGIKEEYWEIDDETARKFVDELNHAHAICCYKKQEPQYIYVHKKVWERMDELEAILADTSLSETDRIEKIKQLS